MKLPRLPQSPIHRGNSTMRLFTSVGVWILLGSLTPIYGQNKAKLAQDVWEVALVKDAQGKEQKIGYAHFTVQEITLEGEKLLRARKELRLTIGRGEQMAEVKADVGTDETHEGKVVGVYMKQWLGKEQTLVLQGKLQEKEMHVTVDGPVSNERKLPWNPNVIGLIREQSLLREKKVKSGDKFNYLLYEPTINNFLRIDVTVGSEEEISLPGGKRKLLRIESKPQKLEQITLPSSVMWVEPTSYIPLVTQMELPGLGFFKLVRSNKEAALAPNGNVPELFSAQSIRLSKPIDNIHTATAITYRVTLKSKDSEPKGLVKEDNRQTIDKIEGNRFNLHVEAIRSPQSIDKSKEVGDEYQKSNHFINSDDKQVIGYAKEAVGDEKDAWKKAQMIERWVHSHMKPVDYTEAMATASHVAKTLSGDCTEYAMLTAAMCRAQEIPSRTSIGLVYVHDRKLGPILAFHMWTEVFVQGQWLGIDATIGKGSIGPGHVKITDHHWHDIRAFDPLLPVTRFLLSKPSMEVIAVRRPN
jgi:transglutaminase-like putative cysteine protease